MRCVVNIEACESKNNEKCQNLTEKKQTTKRNENNHGNGGGDDDEGGTGFY